MASPLRLRLLQDIAEIQTKPYPGIALHIQDEDISTGCLVLTVQGYGKMHTTICFNDDYPLSPPSIRMDSKVTHPNIKEAGHMCFDFGYEDGLYACLYVERHCDSITKLLL